jgi:uncharacterized membrane protein (UPF0127 family)/CheY-like chemotaxis protein
VELQLTRGGGAVLLEQCTLADSPLKRARGLLGRNSLAANEGLYLASSAIHTCFMRFPIDAVFLDDELRVVKIVSNLRSWRIAACRGAKGVVEVAAGECERQELAVGEKLSLGGGLQFAGARANGGVTEAAALRIVVATRDRRFRRVAEFLLSRQGMQAEFERDTDAAVELAERTRPDVVLLDGSSSLASVARGMNRLSALDPPPRVVIVGDEVIETPKTLSVIPKWGSFGEILEAIRLERKSVEET